METTLTSPGRLNDRELLDRVHGLARGEREATAALVAHLAELDERRLYLNEGYSSLFTYCTKALHYSESAAWNRQEAARAARRFPVVLELLGTGALHLTAIRLLRPHLTPENHRELLTRARHRCKREIEELIAEIRPLPDVESIVRKLPVRPTARVATPSEMQSVESAHEEVTAALLVPMPERSGAAALAPLSPDRYKIQFTASREMYERVQKLRELLRHQIPDGNVADILDLATRMLLERVEKTKFAASPRPRALKRTDAAAAGPRDERGETPVGDAAARRACDKPKSPSRHIPAGVRRTVWERDGGQCAFRSPVGGRCGERGRLEFHHLEPFAIGGAATADNIALRCAAHNRLEAEITLGRPVIERARRMSVGGTNGRHGAAEQSGTVFSFRNEKEDARSGP